MSFLYRPIGRFISCGFRPFAVDGQPFVSKTSFSFLRRKTTRNWGHNWLCPALGLSRRYDADRRRVDDVFRPLLSGPVSKSSTTRGRDGAASGHPFAPLPLFIPYPVQSWNPFRSPSVRFRKFNHPGRASDERLDVRNCRIHTQTCIDGR